MKQCFEKAFNPAIQSIKEKMNSKRQSNDIERKILSCAIWSFQWRSFHSKAVAFNDEASMTKQCWQSAFEMENSELPIAELSIEVSLQNIAFRFPSSFRNIFHRHHNSADSDTTISLSNCKKLCYCFFLGIFRSKSCFILLAVFANLLHVWIASNAKRFPRGS